MATVVNFMDVTLQAAAARGVNLPTADIQLLPSAWLFKVNSDGSITPETITFTATPVDLDAQAFTFNATGAPMTGVTAKSVTVAGAAVTGSSVTVIASAVINGRTYTKPCTIQKLQDGVVGSTTYTWIKYADSAAGAGLSDDPTGKAYIGLAYNKTTATESTIASDYTWSLIKGTDGQPGPPGSTTYTWIKYADYANGDGMYDLPTANTLYIGISVNKTTATESNNPGDYVWSRFKGDQGVPGPALYTWIKYADSVAGAGLSDDPTGKAYIGFAYNKTTPVESENPTDYTWSLNQGGQGVPGQPGQDGKTFYTWIKYADVPDGTGLYDVPNSSTVYIGIAVNKVTATESTNKADYTWSKFRGDQGVPGNPGQPGQRGTVDISAGTAGSVWSDSEATAAIAQTGYGVPQMLDVVTLYNQAAGFASTRYWNGSAWVPVSQVINGSLLVKNTVAADKIDTRGLSIKDPQGNTILAAGSALPAAYAAPGTLNSDIVVGGRNLAQDSAFEGRLRPWAQVSGGSRSIEGSVGAKNLFIEGSGDVYVNDGGPAIPVTPGKLYMLSCEYATSTTGTITGSSSLFYAGSGTAPLPLAPLNTAGVRTRCVVPWTCPSGVTAIAPRFGFVATAYSWMRVYNFKVEEGNKATAWDPAPEDVDGATIGQNLRGKFDKSNISTFIEAAAIGLALIDKASINNLAALSAYLGSVEIAAGGALRSGQTAFHVGKGFYLGFNNGVPVLSIGDPSGSSLRWDGAQLIVNNPTLQLANRTVSISSPSGTSFTHARTTTGGYCGSHTASMSGAANPTYLWTAGASPWGQMIISGATSATCGLSVVGPGGRDTGGGPVDATFDVTCTVSDGGVTKSSTITISVTFQ